jgi:hypothetical protein
MTAEATREALERASEPPQRTKIRDLIAGED